MAVALDFKNHSVNVLLPLLLMVDSSKVATSYMMYQIVDGEILTIDMDSRVLSKPEKAQPSVTRESLGIVYCLRKNEPLIRSHPPKTILFTDCSSLIFLPRASSYNMKYYEMALYLSSFPQLDIVSFPAKNMFLCDLGSRLFYDYTFQRSGSAGISELFAKIYPLAPAQCDYTKISNRELSLLLFTFQRKEWIDVLANTQFKL